MSVVAHQKYYLADKKPFFKHFYPRDVTITAVRSVAIQSLMVLNGFVDSLTLEESEEEEEDTATEEEDEIDTLKHSIQKKKKKEEEEKKEWTPPSPVHFTTLCLTSFIKSFSITTCVRSLEEVAIRLFRPQIVGKLIKDVSKSATRKYLRTHSKVTAAMLMAKTGMRSNILGHIAIFLIEESHQILLILYRRYCQKGIKEEEEEEEGMEKEKEKKKKDSVSAAKKKQLRFKVDEEKKEKEKKSFLSITLKNASRSTLAVATGGIGAAVGTLIRPGLGTVVGATLGDTIAYVV